VASLVCLPRMISTSCMTGTGFMKCMPITRSGAGTLAASRVMGIEEVLLARTASCGITLARLEKTFFFTSSFSVTASTANCAERASSRAPGLSRARAACASSAFSLPLPTALSSCVRMPASPFCTSSGLTSIKMTWSPLCAPAWAIPAPICPAPTTASVFTSTIFTPKEEARR